MNLAERLPTLERRIDAARITTWLWVQGFAFVFIIGILFLLNRLGLPMTQIANLAGCSIILFVLFMSWQGRTMSSEPYFFAARATGIAPTGLGGLTDWLSGSLIVIILALPSTHQMLAAPAIMLAILVHAVLFAVPFQRSGVATLSGFLSWRTGKPWMGMTGLLFAVPVLLLILMAELQIAFDLLGLMTGLSPQTVRWTTLALVLVPAMFGGWISIAMVNAALASFMLVTILVPAIGAGFFSTQMSAAIPVENAGALLEPLDIVALSGWSQTLDFGTGFANFALAALIICCGLAAMPHAMARISLGSHHVSSVESTGWSAMTGFLIISALPLSIGLVLAGADSGSKSLAEVLKQVPVLHMLPYWAITIAAFNLSMVSIFVLSSSVIRTFRRSRHLDPGERSMFITRVFCLLVIVGLGLLDASFWPTPGAATIGAICISAAAFFPVLVAVMWVSRIPVWATVGALVMGGATTLVLVAPLVLPQLAHLAEFAEFTRGLPQFHPFQSAGIGFLLSTFILLVGRLTLLGKRNFTDTRLADIRSLSRDT